MPHRASLVAVLLVAVLVGGLLPLAAPPPARAAATFTVTTTGDGGDDTPDGACDSNPTRFQVDCTLREAIQEANFAPGADAIRFDIFEAVGPALKTIRPASPLPTITEEVTIDGYTQPGARPNTAAVGTNAVLTVELDGTNAGPRAAGLLISGGAHTVIRGLVVNRFQDGIGVLGATTLGVRVVGCFLGTDATGTEARANTRGVLTHGARTVIGDEDRGDRNLISGFREAGVVLGGGEDDAGFGAAEFSLVQGNLIGTNRTGAAPLAGGSPNWGPGVVSLANFAVIGGDGAAAANVIAFAGTYGVVIGDRTGARTPRGNQILRNAIFDNGNSVVGINLLGGTQAGGGATANDPGDGDNGPNNLQNTPVLTRATTVGAVTTIAGSLNSTPRRTFVLHFYANPPGGDEGKTFLGRQFVTTDANGNADFAFAPERRVALGKTITATATDHRLNTSEFSPPRTVEPGTIGG